MHLGLNLLTFTLWKAPYAGNMKGNWGFELQKKALDKRERLKGLAQKRRGKEERPTSHFFSTFCSERESEGIGFLSYLLLFGKPQQTSKMKSLRHTYKTFQFQI